MCRVAVWLLTLSKQFKVIIIGVNDDTSLIRYLTGFFRSIALRNENALQDTLRLLTLWFKFGAHDDVSQAMASGFSVVEVDTWLEVIPQVSIV
jgi:phosphatidylinositol kinase/protein kinase (PI-3  family)